MPSIPDDFFTPLVTVKGASTTAAEFQHLLNHPSILDARGIRIDDAQRYALLREVASALVFLHSHRVCVGDISPKNLLFRLNPSPAVYFIDCDAMRINGISVLRQLETPGWEAPSGEELATIYTDTYKLGLLALRLLVGDHDTTNPRRLPPTKPNMLRQIITDTLEKQPGRRPLPDTWAALGLFSHGSHICAGFQCCRRAGTGDLLGDRHPGAGPPNHHFLHGRIGDATDHSQRLHTLDDHAHAGLGVRRRLDRGDESAAVEQAQLQDHPQRRQGVGGQRKKPATSDLRISRDLPPSSPKRWARLARSLARGCVGGVFPAPSRSG
jgi:serine/threonine protein kinase